MGIRKVSTDKSQAAVARSVGLLLVDHRGWVLLQLRDGGSIHPYHWGTVGGSVEAGETLEAALDREVMEEIHYQLPAPPLRAARGVIELPDGQRRDVTVFVAAYDDRQPIECHEGLRIEFVNPHTLDDLRIYPGQKPLILAALAAYRAVQS